MGAVKHQDRVMDFFRKSPLVTVSSLKKIVGENNSYIYLMLNKMVKQGKIYRVSRGAYSLHDDPALAVFCFKPAYLGLQEALSVHNLWEQETNTVILTTKIVREGIRDILGSNVIVKRLPQELFFGVEYVQYGGMFVPVSDIEKTLLDMIYFKQPIEKELYSVLRKKMDKKKLQGYLTRYDLQERKKIINFINKKRMVIKKRL